MNHIMGMEPMNNGLMTVVLKVDMHCECKGCLEKIEKGMDSLKKLEEVERIWKDLKTGTVMVIGTTTNVRKLCEILRRKTGKTVAVVFPDELTPTSTQPHVGSSSQVMPLPSAPPIGEMWNSKGNEVRQLEEELEAQNIELERYRKLIREIMFDTTTRGI